jgi:hypothetical protein
MRNEKFLIPTEIQGLLLVLLSTGVLPVAL